MGAMAVTVGCRQARFPAGREFGREFSKKIAVPSDDADAVSFAAATALTLFPVPEWPGSRQNPQGNPWRRQGIIETSQGSPSHLAGA
jgi:hypothetical protein